MRLRYSAYNRQNNDLQASASSHEPVAVVLREQQEIDEIVAEHTAPSVKFDFAIGAQAYKKHHTRDAALKVIKIATSLCMALVVILGVFGFWLNHKYAGRALPFSYVGGMSVGGLTQPQIKHALDEKAKTLTVTFVDGGLTRTVPASMFGATFDTQTASQQIIPEFNPFAFLDQRSINVPVKINDYQVDGYMRININPSQTKPVDAVIVKDKTKIIVKAPTTGFRSDPKFVADNISLGLANLKDPVINVNAATLKPKITEADLADDVAKANKLLGTNVTIAYGKVMNIVTPAQKLAWVQFDSANGTKDVQISFSRSLVRQYVVDLAKKYQAPAQVVTPVTPATTDPATPNTANPSTPAATVAVPVTPPEVIDNIEQVTDAIVAGLNNGQATALKFVSTKVQAVKPTDPTNPQSSVANR